MLCLTRAVGTFSEDRPLGWDPVARRAIGRAMEWLATATTAASGGNRELLLGQRPARRKCRPRHDADAGCRNPYFVSEEKVPAARAPSREKVKLKNPQIFQFYKKS